ncbi:hypothetical protein BDV39DRAFT_171597 [Aspergillus sergii]|uniref:Zn(2)-C6 fungal-type domain-containing protein n=1 Tax=Aspergillus sergii TaxID=1034303 RepID=A0A5N6X9G9_9EURO|nr:hypothetical protein BDV39DRAFT_171597 [Aspergillus sergii]
MGRLGYRKSKNGCLRCKKRRVKCDEQVPCTACKRHKVECSLERPGRGKALETSLTGAPKHQMRSKPNNVHSLPVRGQSPQANSFPEACTAIGFSELCLLDLELMHHFTTNTCMMGPHVLDPSVFRDELPRLGLRYPYLLHQLLALSAFHCAYLRTESREKYLFHGSKHQAHAIAGMRLALTGKMTEETSFALFMTSALLMTSSFASHLKYPHNEAMPPLAGMLEIMALVRGLSAIKTTTHAELQFNVLDKLKHHNGSQPCWKALDLFKTQLTILQSRISNLTNIDNATVAVLNKGVQSMLDCATMPASTMTGELQVVFTWLSILPADFFNLMQAQHPGAMVVLLYYVVALQEVETQCWVLEGWSAQLTSNIADILCPPWTGLAQWAMNELGYSRG